MGLRFRIRSYNTNMAATILPSEIKIESDELYRLSAEQYDAMVAAGTLGPDDPVELIDGLLIQKMPQNGPHTTVVVKLNAWLVVNAMPYGYSVRPQVPIRLPGSTRPEPDLAVAQGEADDFPDQPTGDQILLAVEVDDQASDNVLRKKILLYAQGGVRELWVIDVQGRRIELHREPSENGYKVVAILAETEPFAPLFLPGQTLRGSDVLPRIAGNS